MSLLLKGDKRNSKNLCFSLFLLHAVEGLTMRVIRIAFEDYPAFRKSSQL